VTASGDELRGWVAHLEARAAARPLGRNASVLERELGELRRMAEAAPAGPARPAAALLDEAAAELRAWNDGEVAWFDVDHSLILRRVAPDAADVFGLDLRAHLDGPSAAWMDPLRARYGSLRSSEVEHRPDGTTHWTLDLGEAGAGHRVRAVRAATGAGESWVLALRADRPTRPPG
jgi:hypothetical protein